ncbi:MAG: sulfatase-like hydrolase/transferase [Verrucomicrobiota bacterium]
MIRDREVIAETVQQEQFTSLYTTEAVKWIDDHRDQPFFLYLAHNMPHAPIIAPARREIVNPSPTSPEPFGGSAERSASSEPEISRLVEVEDPYGDVIEGLDRSVGAIVSATEAAQIAENTLIIFTSDNGPWTVFGPRHAGTAAPLRGEKSTTWEGGMRVPTIFYWPGKIAPAVIDGIGANLDLYATFAALVGGEEPSDLPGYQSEDLCGTLLDAEPSPRTTWLYERSAYRSGDFKIHLQTRSPTNPHTRQKTPSISHDPPLLYNLADDPGENHNIAGQHPEVVARLRAESAELLTQ